MQFSHDPDPGKPSDSQTTNPNNLDKPLSAVPSSDWVNTLHDTQPVKLVASSKTSNPAKRQRSHETQESRDFSSLDKSELIDMIKKLQEQNLLLTRCLAESRATTTTASPEKEGPSGTMLSKYATHPTDFPVLSKGKSSGNTAPTFNFKFSDTAFSTAAKKGASKNTKPQKKKMPRATPKAKEWATRLFTATNSENPSSTTAANSKNGFTFVYLPSNKRTSYSELRERIKLLGVNLNRVYSIGRPARNVVSLLIHQGYEADLLTLFDTAGIKPVTNFNPTSGNTIGDPKLIAELKSDIQKEEKAKSLYYNNLLRATVQLRNAKLGLNILTHFSKLSSSDSFYVPDAIVQQFIKLKPQSVSPPRKSGSKLALLGGFDAASIFTSLNSTDTTGRSDDGEADSSKSNNDENADPDSIMHD